MVGGAVRSSVFFPLVLCWTSAVLELWYPKIILTPLPVLGIATCLAAFVTAKSRVNVMVPTLPVYEHEAPEMVLSACSAGADLADA